MMKNLYVILGFENSYKTTVIEQLCRRIAVSKPTSISAQMLEDCLISGKQRKILFGRDGDDYDCVRGNIDAIAANWSKCDAAVIPLRRAKWTSVDRVGCVWQKWIGRAIADARAKHPGSFIGYESYYIHSEFPLIHSAAKPDGCVMPITDPRYSSILTMWENHIHDVMAMTI